jgi:lysozyme family protein
MTALNFDACYNFTMEMEGGYSDDPNDPGNWTGCACHKGQLKGTNKGISACAYPSLDIANLSDSQIQQIYEDDYWDTVAGDALPMGVDLCTWDSGVNCGPGKGIEWLQVATGNPHADGVMGPETLSWVARCSDTDAVIDSICDQRLMYCQGLATWPTYGTGWSSRIAAMRSLAHEMAAAAPKPPPEPRQQVITITITVSPGVTVNVVTA